MKNTRLIIVVVGVALVLLTLKSYHKVSSSGAASEIQYQEDDSKQITDNNIETESFEKIHSGLDALEKQYNRKIAVQEKRLKDFTQFIEQRRNIVEDKYSNNIYELSKKVEQELIALDNEEEYAKARFLQGLYNTRKSITGYIATDGSFTGTADEYVIGNPALGLEIAMQSIEESRIETLSDAEDLLLNIERRRNGFLRQIEIDEQKGKSNISSSIRGIERWYQMRTGSIINMQDMPFIINLITHSEHGSSFVSDIGIHKEGDTVNGYKIRKILDNSVIAEKDGEEVVCIMN